MNIIVVATVQIMYRVQNRLFIGSKIIPSESQMSSKFRLIVCASIVQSLLMTVFEASRKF